MNAEEGDRGNSVGVDAREYGRGVGVGVLGKHVCVCVCVCVWVGVGGCLCVCERKCACVFSEICVTGDSSVRYVGKGSFQ